MHKDLQADEHARLPVPSGTKVTSPSSQVGIMVPVSVQLQRQLESEDNQDPRAPGHGPPD